MIYLVRAASPLPPNVPTGPRNKNKYKDIDGSAPAVDGLDYGGGKDRTTPPDHDDRSSRSVRLILAICTTSLTCPAANGEARRAWTTEGAQNDDDGHGHLFVLSDAHVLFSFVHVEWCLYVLIAYYICLENTNFWDCINFGKGGRLPWRGVPSLLMTSRGAGLRCLCRRVMGQGHLHL